ncbi:MAG: thiamine phosphate synthase [Alphaproteobacteria bacterium]|nr:thiamine phosphate synthase [Alphaproteobacteria bacterium]
MGDPPLLVITDRRQAARPLAEILEAIFAAGCHWASLREKDLPSVEQRVLLRELLPIARRWGARLTLHGDAALAAEAGLDGVHLAAGGDPASARAALPAGSLIGISIHRIAEARALDPALIDYAIAGPAFATASKPGYGPALGVDGLQAIVRASQVPVIAIGGIEAGDLGVVERAGAAGIAVMGAVMRSRDPAREVRALLAALAQSDAAQRAR